MTFRIAFAILSLISKCSEENPYNLYTVIINYDKIALLNAKSRSLHKICARFCEFNCMNNE